MRSLFELGVFGMVTCVAFAIVFAITVTVGSPIGLDIRRAALLAAVILCFWLPAFVNVRIAVSGPNGESQRCRVCAAARAFGILICSAALTAPLLAPAQFGYSALLFVGGALVAWGSLLFESRL